MSSGADTCEVWWARPQDVGPAHDALLGRGDLERRARLAGAGDRARLTAAWALARVVLGRTVGVEPPDLEVDRTCPRCCAPHGRPRLPQAPELSFSLSHSGDAVALAVVVGGPVGIDVERLVAFEVAELAALADCTLSAEEQAELAAQPAQDRSSAFTTYWVRKEAVLKATGDGLVAPLPELVVSPPSQLPRVLRWDRTTGSEPLQAPLPSLQALHPPAGFAAALALADGRLAHVVERDAGPLLREVIGGSDAPAASALAPAPGW